VTRNTMTSLKQALLLGDGGVISLVGAGGKTSLMFALARELVEAGMTVITTTTTKIYVPSPNQSAHIVASESVEGVLSQARNLVNNYPHVTTAAAYSNDKRKLIGLSPESVDVLWESDLFQWIIVEADGAAGKPLKAPASHEPVIPESTRTVVAVSGLNAVGKPLTDQWVFRPEVFSMLTGLKIGDPVTETAVIDVLIHKKGVMKGAPVHAENIALFNQTEKPDKTEKGKAIFDLLRIKSKTGLKRAILATLSENPQVIDYIDL